MLYKYIIVDSHGSTLINLCGRMFPSHYFLLYEAHHNCVLDRPSQGREIYYTQTSPWSSSNSIFSTVVPSQHISYMLGGYLRAARLARSVWHISLSLPHHHASRPSAPCGLWSAPGILARSLPQHLTRPSSSTTKANPRTEAPAAVPLATVEMSIGRSPKAIFIQKADAAQELGLMARDLRAVDPSFRLHSPAILPRQNAIIINLAHVRIIVLADRALVFDPVNPAIELFIPRLQKRLDSPGHPMPFEFRAVEAVLVDVCASFNSTLGTLIPSVDVVLDTLSTTTDFGGGTVQNCMDRLLPLENALNEFSAKVAQARAALNEVLTSDEDMSLMYLTTFKETGHRRRIDQHDEMEMMLENYVKQLDTIYGEVTSALRAVKTTETATQIRLDAMRNRVLRLDVFLNLGAVSVGMGGLVAGAFGMNLESGWEEHPAAFWIVSGVAVLTTVVCFRGVLAYLRYRRIFQ